MNVNSFADAQRSHNTVYPEFDGEITSNEECIPFERLLDGKESSEILQKRWELYHQLHSHFHAQVDNIVANIEVDLKTEITNILFGKGDEDEISFVQRKKPCFKTLFLLGSDSSTEIQFPDDALNDKRTFNSVIDLSAKESPNVRMMLRRSMFKLFSQADKALRNRDNIKREDEGNIEDEEEDLNDSESIDMSLGLDPPARQVAASYDLTLVENFKILFKRELVMVFNFKDVDSFNYIVLNDFILLLQSALKNKHVKISLVFNINTNLSNLENNLDQSILRNLKRKYYKLDVSSNKGYKYGNRIFQSFLDTVDGKLNLSEKFVKFILDKMSNNTNHNLQLLTKILDYSLMSYFYQNPFSVFIDPVNIVYLKDSYLDLLSRCPTFMFFIDGLVKENAPQEDILGLLTNHNNTLEDFFVEFLVRDNPINRHAKFVADFLEEKLHITNYNLIELYYNLLQGKLDTYLDNWPTCHEHKETLAFEPIDTIFKELFTLDNRSGLLSQSMFPSYKTNLEDGLLNWERVLPLASIIQDDRIEDTTSLTVLNDAVGPIVSQLYKLYREASPLINVYDFYTAFKETLPQEEMMDFLNEEAKADDKLLAFLQSNDKAFDKIALILFMQALFDLEHVGIIRATTGNSSEEVEKATWRGI